MTERALPYVIVFSLAGSVGALLGGGLLAGFPGLHRKLRTLLLSYAVGALLGAAFLGLLPGASERLGADLALQLSLAGYLFFFFLEKILRLPHGHAQLHPECEPHQHESHARPAAVLILIGDAVHNFIDGILIAVTFSISIPLGMLTAAAIVAHEIPQEFGDMIVLLEAGWSTRTAYLINFLSSLTTVFGALLAYWAGKAVEPLVPYLLAFSGAGFLYVAGTDLSPVLHHVTGRRAILVQFLGVLVGVGTILGLHSFSG